MSTLITPTTELEAVNTMLSVIGEAPVNQLATSTSVETKLAQQILNEVCRAVQVAGWHFNTEKDFPLPRNNSNEIVLSSNIIKADTAIGKYSGIDVVQRGVRLYDRKNHTYAFTQDLVATVTFLLDMSELPEAARRYIVVRASRIFQDRLVGSNEATRVLLGDESQAWAELKDAELECGDYSIFDNSDFSEAFVRL